MVCPIKTELDLKINTIYIFVFLKNQFIRVNTLQKFVPNNPTINHPLPPRAPTEYYERAASNNTSVQTLTLVSCQTTASNSGFEPARINSSSENHRTQPHIVKGKCTHDEGVVYARICTTGHGNRTPRQRNKFPA